MDIDNLGYGAGGGLVSAILVALGWKARLDRQDHEIMNLKTKVVYKDVFEQFEKRFDSFTESVGKLNDKIDILLTRRRADRNTDQNN